MLQALSYCPQRLPLSGRGGGVEAMAVSPWELSCSAKSFSPTSYSGYHCFRDGSNENYTTLETWLFSFKFHRTASAKEDKGLVVKRGLDPDTWVPTQQLYLPSCWVTLGWLLNCSEPHCPHQKNGDPTVVAGRRKWQPTPVFLPEESQGWRSLVGCRLWGRMELDTTEAT